jgi:hypothetical protein
VEDGDIRIDEAADVPKMEEVRVVTGELYVRPAVAGEIDSLCPLRPLQRVGNSLVVSRTGVASLDGLQSLTRVEHGIAIANNESLTTLGGLEQLVDIVPCDLRGLGGDAVPNELDLVVMNNRNLEPPVISAFVEGLEERLGRTLGVFQCGNGSGAVVDLCGAGPVVNRVNSGETLCQ